MLSVDVDTATVQLFLREDSDDLLFLKAFKDLELGVEIDEDTEDEATNESVEDASSEFSGEVLMLLQSSSSSFNALLNKMNTIFSIFLSSF
mmetsp:Transcript_31393/g.57004  ORF Transcript_31393/g.57004 Transcript_31393/m.57004 type:complete len:91 (+) Transcript_31393:371-643(+)